MAMSGAERNQRYRKRLKAAKRRRLREMIARFQLIKAHLYG